MSKNKPENRSTDGIAIVGMAGKFPGVENIHEYWQAISEGKELLKRFSDEELNTNNVDDTTRKHKYFVPVNGLIHSAEFFDSSFFGFTPREADLTDPQHRKFLEVCYEALEHGGQSPDKYSGSIGVFAGCSMNNYLLKNLLQFPELLKNNGEFQTIVNNDKDFLTTKVSYKLNLTGPSFDIQTACSTSLVAIHVACQNLLNYQCDIALGGGSFIMNPRGHGYMFKPGGIESAVGTCRPFDKDADGTVFGEGVGVVALKRLEDAIEDKDEIWAVIRSSAINNDGSFKIGYMAPSSDGQSEAISMALEFGDIDPRTISYVETHGTGTNLGDPIEISGLTNVYRKYTADVNYCAIGSVKGNIGHCDVAAGVAGIIKTAMALKYKKLPPSINFDAPNPELQLETSPFFVNTELRDWEVKGMPRRAAISSFGIGGTNAHCILEEWDDNKPEPSKKDAHLLPLSAKSQSALDKMIQNLVEHLGKSTQELGDIAYTLQNGRNVYSHKALLAGSSKEEILSRFAKGELKNVSRGKNSMSDPAVIFMFTGQGSQYINMAKGLYESFGLYRNIVDEAHEILSEQFDIDLKNLMFNDFEDKDHQQLVNLTSNTQPLLFVVQYATACLLIEFGIFPDAMIGHSIGELTAATLSGVFSFEDGLKLVASRGEIMQQQQPGSMLSVNLSVEDLTPYLEPGIELALQNAPNYSVVSGTHEAIAAFETKLKAAVDGIHTTVLKTSHAFHSGLMEPALQPFINEMKSLEFANPEIPFISNVTGTWITPEQATSPQYWADHIRSTVRFADGINEIMASESEVIFIETGPGNSLSMLLSQFDVPTNYKTISTIRHPRVQDDDKELFFKAIADYWIAGGYVNWDEIYEDEERFKVPLPTYPFEQKRHWIDPLVNVNYYIDSLDKGQAADNKQGAVSQPQKVAASATTYHSRPDLNVDYIAPSTKIEQQIVEIWQELLGIEGIGVRDDFFDLGGHSLLASQLVVRINEKFRIKLPLDGIFNTPTIGALIEKYNLKAADDHEHTDLSVSKTKAEHPLSMEQMRLWLINKIDQNNPAYNIPFTYKLKGEVNFDILNQSFRLLLERHQVLKSCIIQHNNEPVSKVRQDEFSIKFIDISNERYDAPEDYVQQLLSEDTRTSFDIEHGPLIRVTLIKIAEREFVFHLTVQHMVFDGWSWGIFSKELSQIYNDLIEKRPVSLPDPDMQYFDFSRWQSDNSQAVANEKSIEFWKNQLKDVPLETKFPYDHKRPALISGLGGRENIEIDQELASKIKKISKESGSTVFMTMLTAFGALINLYSNEDDICIGTPTANRTRSAFERIIGFFVNTIVFRLKFDKSRSFKEILNTNRQMFLDSLEHQDLYFEKLVDVLQPERIMNINPVFQIMFAWQNAPRPPLGFKDVEQQRVVLQKGISPLDITFYMWENNGIIEGEIEFNEDILERESIIHLKNNFVRLLQQITQNIETPLNELNGISDFSQRALSKFNSTEVPVPDKRLHELFEERAEVDPEQIAVISGSKKLTYSELNKEANKLADKLIKKNVTGNFIGVSLPRNEQMLITILAILKAGASYLPLDPDFPDDRLKYILKDAGARLLITNKEIRSKFKGIDTEILLLDKVGSIFNLGAASVYKNPNLNISPDSLAYTIYTSGSTGNPKGVKVQHSAAVNFILSMAKKPGINAGDKLLAVTTLSFDISVLELFLPISTGATVVIAASEDVADGRALTELMKKDEINLMQATPATWNLLIMSGWKGNKNLKALCGGEALPAKLVKDLVPIVKELWNMYGPTETTVWSTCKQIKNTDEEILVGHPIDNTRIYILDKANRELPMGVFGEVCIGGLGVTKGYHKRDELTSEKFISFKNNEIIYKTGDMGRILTLGDIELQGRIDNQIKLRGFRIEPGEIETIIGTEMGIKEVVVKVQKFDDFDERLIAFIRADDPLFVKEDRIKSKIRSRLPQYMVPSNFVVMKDFPRTPNGKVDRKALIFKPDYESSESELIEPKNDTQKRILTIWQKALKSQRIGIKDNFFDVGGNSLMAVHLVQEIEKEFDISLNLRIFFDSPVIDSIAEYIDINFISERENKLVESSGRGDIIEGEI